MAVLIVLDALDADAGGTLANFQHDRGIPAVHVTADIDFGQGRAPGRVISQLVRRQRLSGAAPNAQVAVVFQLGAKRLRRLDLQFGIHRGADRQAAAKELLFAEVAAELAANFIREVIPRRQLRAKRFVVTVLHGFQRLRFRRLVSRLVDIAVFQHLS